MHSWTAVILMARERVNAFDFGRDQLLLLLSCRGLSSQPFVKSRARDFQHAAQGLYWPAFFMLFDEFKPQPFSFAKKAVAFLKMSRSIFN